MSKEMTFGLNKAGELVHIDEVESGSTDLKCFFCKKLLVAKKGKINKHHFAHLNGETCRDYSISYEKTQIPLFESFNFLDSEEKKFLELFLRYGYKNIFPWLIKKDVVQRLQDMGIIRMDVGYSEELEETIENLKDLGCNVSFTKEETPLLPSEIIPIFEALSPITGLDLVKAWNRHIEISSVFLTDAADRHIQRALLIEPDRYLKFNSIKRKNEAQLFWIQAYLKKIKLYEPPEIQDYYAKKMEILQDTSLYIMEFILGEKIIYKIGITARSTQVRMEVIILYLKGFEKVHQAKVIFERKGLARMESLLHKHFESSNLQIGNHQEFFILENPEKLIKDLESLEIWFE